MTYLTMSIFTELSDLETLVRQTVLVIQFSYLVILYPSHLQSCALRCKLDRT